MSGVAKSDRRDRSRDCTWHRCDSSRKRRRDHAHRGDARSRCRHGARVSLRINPGIEIDSHAHVATGHDEAKFGIARADLGEACAASPRHASHSISSAFRPTSARCCSEVSKYLESARVVCEVASMRLSLGGQARVRRLRRRLRHRLRRHRDRAPCRFRARSARASARAGALSVAAGARAGSRAGRAVRRARGAGDAGQAERGAALGDDRRRHERLVAPGPLRRHAIASSRSNGSQAAPSCRVVGPVCESADDFGEHALGEPIPELVVIRDAGAYGFTMASNYNGRALAGRSVRSRGARDRYQHGSRRGNLGQRAPRRLSENRAYVALATARADRGQRLRRAPPRTARTPRIDGLVLRARVEFPGAAATRGRSHRARTIHLALDHELDAERAAAPRQAFEVDARARSTGLPAATDRRTGRRSGAASATARASRDPRPRESPPVCTNSARPTTALACASMRAIGSGSGATCSSRALMHVAVEAGGQCVRNRLRGDGDDPDRRTPCRSRRTARDR